METIPEIVKFVSFGPGIWWVQYLSIILSKSKYEIKIGIEKRNEIKFIWVINMWTQNKTVEAKVLSKNSVAQGLLVIYATKRNKYTYQSP